MSNTLKLIERIRSTTETGTDYAIAKALGMTQSNLIEIKKGKRWPSLKSQIRIAELLKIDLKDVVALINEDKAKTDTERAHWRALCAEAVHSKFAAAVSGVIVAATLIWPSGDAGASTSSVYEPGMPYARLRRWIRRQIRGLAGPIPRVIAAA